MVNPVVFFADFFFLGFFFLLVYFFLGFAFFLSSSFYLLFIIIIFLSMREDREIEKKRGSWVWLVARRERERENNK